MLYKQISWIAAKCMAVCLLMSTNLHGGGKEVAALSCDGKIMAIGYADQKIRVYDMHTKNCMITIDSGHTEKINLLVFSPDGYMLASGSKDKTVKLWEISTGTCKNTFSQDEYSATTVTFNAGTMNIVWIKGESPHIIYSIESVYLYGCCTIL